MDNLIITKESYPYTYDILDAISHDGGGRAGHAGYAIDNVKLDDLTNMELCLCVLNKDDTEIFVFGEQSECEALMDGFPDLRKAHNLIGRWFDQSVQCSCCGNSDYFPFDKMMKERRGSDNG